MPALQKNDRDNLKTKRQNKLKPKISAHEKDEAAKNLEKKTARVSLMAAIGDAEPAVKTKQLSAEAAGEQPVEPKKEGPEEHPGVRPKEEPPAPIIPPTPPTTARPKQTGPAESTYQEHVLEEEGQDAVVETAIQAVRDSQVPVTIDKGCDPDMINALQIAEDKLAAIAGASGGAAQELPRSALDLQVASQTMSNVHQSAPAQASPKEEKRHEKTPEENAVVAPEHHLLPEPEPSE